MTWTLTKMNSEMNGVDSLPWQAMIVSWCMRGLSMLPKNYVKGEKYLFCSQAQIKRNHTCGVTRISFLLSWGDAWVHKTLKMKDMIPGMDSSMYKW